MDIDNSKKYTHQTLKNQYTIYLTQSVQSFSLTLQQKHSIYIWSNTFSKQYIQNQITTKTGNPLSFAIFFKLITKSLQMTSGECFIDILTSQDLQNLKNKKQQKDKQRQPQQSKPRSTKSNKRYIILTYMANDARTHYPLPLNVSQEESQPNKLKDIYKSLREELDNHRFKNLNDSKSMSITYEKRNKGKDSVQTKQIDQLKSENEILKSKLKRLQQPKRNANTEFETIENRIKQLKETLQTPNMKLVDLRYSVGEHQESYNNYRAELIDLHQQISKLLITEKETKVRKHGEQVNKELVIIKNTMNKNANQIEKLKGQVEKFKTKNKELEQRGKKLATERDVIKRGGRRGPYSTGSLSVSSKASSYAGSVSSKRSAYSYNSYKYR